MKEVKITVIGILIATILYSPFLMPENWTYISKGVDPIYDKTWYILAKIGTLMLAFFAGIGIRTKVKNFLDEK